MFSSSSRSRSNMLGWKPWSDLKQSRRLFLGLCVLLLLAAADSAQAQLRRACSSSLYCYSTGPGSLLDSVQSMHLFRDSKTFVDMATKVSEAQVQADFARLGAGFSKEQLEAFVSEHFWEAGHEVVNVEPTDWTPTPRLLAGIKDARLRDFASTLNAKWKHLLRKFDRSRICAECATSALLTNHSFVVPGGRFIEYYYWDTYWALLGLLGSDMHETARSVIQNFLEIVETNGFVPNGARIYYLNRSQPPMLTQMVEAFVNRTGDLDFLRQALPLLDKEYQFWLTNKQINYTGADGRVHALNHYHVQVDAPRPESYREDLEHARASQNESRYYMNVYSAAESGWDFSSRWFDDPMNISTIAITDIIPVDLNAILFKNERSLARMHSMVGAGSQADYYRRAHERREEAINQVFWTESEQTWTDFNWRLGRFHNAHQYPTDLTPLWAGVSVPNSTTLARLLERYSGLLSSHVSGVPSSDVHSHQQWDLPNVWAPYHDWLVDLLMRSEATSALAFDIAQRFVATVYCGWRRTGNIFEKYNADVLGGYGEGGEYVVQEGFGWTNGVAIRFLELFGDRLQAPADASCPKPANGGLARPEPAAFRTLVLAIFALFLLLLI